MNADARQLLGRVRFLLALVIVGLVVTGVTAFPLVHEVDALHAWLSARPMPGPVMEWIGKVQQGLHVVAREYPFLSYGTDWLAFGHLVIALFFIGPLIDPVRNVWIIRAGQLACLLVIPTALICGEIRSIPLWWRAIDCAFGVFGFLPLWLAARDVRQLASMSGVAAAEPHDN